VHKMQSQILVPMDTPGITLLRPMTVFDDDDAPKVKLLAVTPLAILLLAQLKPPKRCPRIHLCCQ
jgi:hypothetical protein